MKKLLQLLISFFTIFLLTVLLTNQVRAENEFQSDYKVTYSVAQNGKTTVEQQITLKNNTANYYADQFELKIGSTKVENVTASDEIGPIQAGVKFEDNLTKISVKFNQKVIGLGKSFKWTLTYTSGELAIKSGQIWEVSIPKLAKSEDIGAYEANILVPVSFGPVAYAQPIPKNSSRVGSSQNYIFDKDQLFDSGISMSFGQKQVYQFTLSYYLQNNNLTNTVDEITLPPDSNYQKVVIEKIDPAPKDVDVDEDGNFIAKYNLAPKQSLNIVAQGYVEVFSKPFRNIDKKLTPDEKEKYLTSQSYWERDAAQIKEKAKELKTPQEIYKFVSTYLSYNENIASSADIVRKGAQGAINNPKEVVCMEYTDLFIALSRAAGIPAKEVIGYAYTQNTRLRPLSFQTEGDLLHAWPAYYDDKLGWVQVDPTWGSTSGGLDYFKKMDFNHITLVHRGLSSTSPYPAGSYKKEGQENKKDVNINFALELPQITATPVLNLKTNEKIISGVPTKITAEIKNTGSTSIIGGKLDLQSQFLSPTTTNNVDFEILPPYSNKTAVYSLQTKGFFTKSKDLLILSFNEVQITKPITIIPFYYLLISPGFIVSIVLAILIIVLGLLMYNKLHKKKLLLKNH